MDKWRDVFLMPYSAIESIQPAISGLGALTAFHLTLMLGGLLLGIVFAAKERTLRWILLTTVLWFIVSMAFLSQGAFWHLDVVHPWLAVLAAHGLARENERQHRPFLVGLRQIGLVCRGSIGLALGIVAGHRINPALSRRT